jgi:lysozyme family protein
MKMSDHYKEIIAKVIEREGGSTITNDPDDPGGLTKYGISKRSNPDLDIENLTLDDAIAIYKERYWDSSKADQLPKKLSESYFDMVVNAGKRRAVKILQQACNHKGHDLVVDGLIGKATIGACKSLEASRFKAFRVRYYVDLVKRKPTLMKYYYGWYRRAVEA